MTWLPFDPTPVLKDANVQTLDTYLPGASILVYRKRTGRAPWLMDVFLADEKRYPGFEELQSVDTAVYRGGGGAIMTFAASAVPPAIYRGPDFKRRYSPIIHRALAAKTFQATLESLALLTDADIDAASLSAAMTVLTDELIENHVTGRAATEARS